MTTAATNALRSICAQATRHKSFPIVIKMLRQDLSVIDEVNVANNEVLESQISDIALLIAKSGTRMLQIVPSGIGMVRWMKSLTAYANPDRKFDPAPNGPVSHYRHSNIRMFTQR